MSEDLQLEDLLRQLKGEGQTDSSGAFTMDLERAAPKLRKFLLNNPYHYSLKLIQAGVAAGAHKISIQSGDKTVRIELEGAVFPASLLRNLFYYLLEAQATRDNRAIRHLATGINGVVSLGASRIVLESWDGQEGYRSQWTSAGQSESSQGSPRSTPYLRLELVRSLKDHAQGVWHKLNRDFLAVATSQRSTMDREQACVVDRGACCPVPLRVNGRLVSRSYGFADLCALAPEFAHEASLNDRDFAVLEVAVGDDKASGLRRPHPWQAELVLDAGGAPCLAFLLLNTAWPQVSHLIIVEDGVLLGQQQVYLGRPGLKAVLCGSLFTKDLTGLTVARDEFYFRTLAALSKWTDGFRRRIDEHWDSLSPDVTQRLRLRGAVRTDLRGRELNRVAGPVMACEEQGRG